jgi:hypothetical protein
MDSYLILTKYILDDYIQSRSELENTDLGGMNYKYTNLMTDF